VTRVVVRLASGDVMPPALTADEYAELLRVSTWQVRKTEHDGTGVVPAIWVGHRCVWPTVPTLTALGITGFTVETVGEP
jgi:hypothetical protein